MGFRGLLLRGGREGKEKGGYRGRKEKEVEWEGKMGRKCRVAPPIFE